MKILNALTLLALSISNSSSAQELEITADKQIVNQNSKVQTFIGDVQIKFSENEHPETESNTVSMDKGETVMEGNVKITFDDVTAVTNRVVYIKTPSGLVAKMDKVTITYH